MPDTVSLKEHLLALRDADNRRYAEVNLEREKAIKIKETADEQALRLAREIQTYKDEKANELREQINSERGLYATKEDVEPLKAYISSQTGRSGGIATTTGAIVSIFVGVAAFSAIASGVATLLLSRAH